MDEPSQPAARWFKFIRQARLPPDVVDFLCREAGLIVEVDDATHSEDHQLAYDRRRDGELRLRGYRIIRIQSDDVYKRLTDVLDMILLALDGKLEAE